MPFATTIVQPSVEVKDEGLTVTPVVTSLDFTGAGVTVTAGSPTSNVSVAIPGGGGTSMAYNESLPGTGTAFTLAHSPSPAGSLILIKNGVTLTDGVDYTLAGANLTMTDSVTASDALLAKQYAY